MFTIEALLKSIAYGFVIGHRNCYLRKPMNIVDFVVVIFSLVNILMDILGFSQYMQLKEVRIIRIIRMLKISKQLKRVINCLVNSLQKICYFLVLYLLVLFIYSIIGEFVHGFMVTWTFVFFITTKLLRLSIACTKQLPFLRKDQNSLFGFFHTKVIQGKNYAGENVPRLHQKHKHN